MKDQFFHDAAAFVRACLRHLGQTPDERDLEVAAQKVAVYMRKVRRRAERKSR